MATDPIKPAATTETKWYPHPDEVGGHGQWNAHRQTLDKVYALQDRVNAMEAKPQPAKPAAAENGPSNTKIAGMNVTGAPPSDGQQLTYSAAAGGLVWK